MTTKTEWSQVESSLQDIAPSSDLFDGDILGDELMDIYNAAVVGGADDDDMNDIPSLLGPQGEKLDEAYDTHLGNQVAEAVAAMDDGFGAFRPSTSFNDLTTLLQPSATTSAPATSTSAPAVTANQPPSLAPVVSSMSIAPGPSPTGPVPPTLVKRKAGSNAPPAAKRRNTSAGRKNGAPSTKKKTSPGTAKAVAAKKNKNDTPDPLKLAPVPAVVASAPIVVKPAVVKTVAPVKPVAIGVSPVPSVVTPAAGATAVTAQNVPATQPPTTKVVTEEQELLAPFTVTSATPTEADFKNVAHAAVSNLIMNATSAKHEGPESSAKVDISTDHVKALTGSNWVSVCSGGDSVSSNSEGAADKMNNRARRQNLTPDERARQNRDRNREHARNTRLRKKAYVEELKRTLTALVSQRDSAELEKRHASQRELEQREVRFRVTEEFLKLRGRNEANPARWAAILEDNFTLTLPITDFRDMVHPGNRNQKFEQVLTGVSEIMSDSHMCSAFLQGLGKGHKDITMVYNCDRKNFYMDNCTAMLEFTATTNGAMEQGCNSELFMKGNVQAKFCPASNKLISVVMTFDTGIIMSQLNNLMKVSDHAVDAAAVAAQVAACEADAILDSLQMPHIAPSIPGKVNLVPPSSGSITGSSVGEKEESSDGSDKEEGDDPNGDGMHTRRVLRRQD